MLKVDLKALLSIIRKDGLKGYVDARLIVLKELLTVCSQLGKPSSLEKYGDLCSILIDKSRAINSVLVKEVSSLKDIDATTLSVLRLETPLLKSDKGQVYTVLEKKLENNCVIRTVKLEKGFYMDKLGLARIMERRIKT